MNEKRRKLTIAALSVIVLMGLFPPWTQTFFGAPATARGKRPAGYSFIFTPPRVDEGLDGIVLDVSRLLLQWGIVLGIGGIGWLVSKE